MTGCGHGHDPYVKYIIIIMRPSATLAYFCTEPRHEWQSSVIVVVVHATGETSCPIDIRI